MDTNIICVIAGIAFGLLVAFINSRITKAGLKSKDVTKIMITNMVKFAIDAGSLTAAFFICRAAALPVVPTIISLAITLSLGGVLMAYLVAKKASENDEENKSSLYK